jgi:type II secretory pathway pseudopilin PulG
LFFKLSNGSLTTITAHKPPESRLKRWEIVGAWLKIWTPPRDLEVPPIPWRQFAIASLVGVVVLAAAAALLVPQINRSKRNFAAQQASKQQAADRVLRGQLQADQAVHLRRLIAGTAPVTQLEHAISADARARASARTLDGTVHRTRCQPTPARLAVYRSSRVYKCFVETAGNVRGEGKDTLAGGYPFVGTIYYGPRRIAWCKENPLPGEKAARGTVHVRPSAACAGKLRAVL